MTITTIPWGDGSGDNIYLSAPSQTGDQSISVTSDPNTGTARSKVVTFSASGVSPVSLTINQEAGQISPVFYSYLVFDGIAYIDTDILIPENGSIRFPCGYETTKGYQILFNNGGRIYAYLNTSTNSTRRAFSSAYDSSSTQVSGTTLTLAWTYNSYSFFLTPKRIGFGTTSKTFTKGSSRPTTGLVIGQNAAHTGTPFTGRLTGHIRIYGSDAQNVTQDSNFSNYTPIYTLRPCTYNGEAGLWCVETNKFYGNTAGAGTLTATN